MITPELNDGLGAEAIQSQKEKINEVITERCYAKSAISVGRVGTS